VDFIANRAAESSSQEGSSESTCFNIHIKQLSSNAMYIECIFAVVKQLKASGGALKMLSERLGVIESYLRAVKSGEIQSDR
jgi:hypothetical protein